MDQRYIFPLLRTWQLPSSKNINIQVENRGLDLKTFLTIAIMDTKKTNKSFGKRVGKAIKSTIYILIVGSVGFIVLFVMDW